MSSRLSQAMKWGSQKFFGSRLHDLPPALMARASTLSGRALLALVCIPAVTLLVAAVRVFSSRSWFPMDLEWIEGGMLLHAHRVLSGQELFTKGNEGFMPFSYPPLHTYLVALLGKIFGLDYWLGRALSLASMCGVIFLLSREVFRAFEKTGGQLVWAVLAMGAMIAPFPLTKGWYDLIRNDELVLLMVVGAAILGADRAPMSKVRFWALVCLMNASVFTKQTAAFYLLWLLSFQLVRDFRLGLKLIGALALVGALTTLSFEIGTEHRYLQYTLFVLSEQAVKSHKVAEAFRRWTDFAPYLLAMPVLLGGAAWFRLLNSRAVLWAGMLTAALPATLLPFVKVGGYYNNLLPVAVLAAPAFLCLAASLLERSRLSAPSAWGLSILGSMLFGLYLQERQIDAERFQVTEAHCQKASRLHRRLKSLAPSLLMPQHPFLAIKAGSTVEQFHEMSWMDWWHAGVEGLDLRPFIEAQKPEFVVMTGKEIRITMEALRENYAFDVSIPRDEHVYPLTGFPSFSRWIMRRLPAEPLGTICLFDFEEGYRDFTQTGEAFRSGPQGLGEPNQLVPIGRQGKFLAASLGGVRGEEATGTLTSPEFTITAPRLSLLVGGGNTTDLRIELLVDGKVTRQSTGVTGLDYLKRLEWDVSKFQGRPATIRMVDDDPQGHILLDHVCLHPDRAPAHNELVP